MSGHTVSPKTRPSLDPTQALQQATLLERQGRLREAEALCRQILANTRGHFGALHLLSQICHRGRRLAEAIAFNRKALNQRPNSINAPLKLGMALAKAGRADDAIQRYEKALALDPRHLGALEKPGNISPAR